MARRIFGLSTLRLRMGIEFWLWVAVLGLGKLRLRPLELHSLPLLLPVLLSSGIHMFSQQER